MLILSEENKRLKGTTYKLPDAIYKGYWNIVKNYPQCISDPGYVRAKNVAQKGIYVTMEWLKNMKHFFSVTDVNSETYQLAGGDAVKNFVESTLDNLISMDIKTKRTNSATKPRGETSPLAGMHGDHQSKSLDIAKSLMSGLVPSFESKEGDITLIITEEQLKEVSKYL